MKQVVFISGKGGTGKSTITASLCRIVKEKMIADCDVDAPDLHMLMDGKIVIKEDFHGAKEAFIDLSLCTGCGICRDTCRFDAISPGYEVSGLKCEGCKACVLVCPSRAVELIDVKTGETFISETSYGTFSHALLEAGAEGSGRLVTQVRKNAIKNGKNEKLLLIDGSPGIGCVVIASITGTDAVVVVTEPTMTGISDLKRILAVAAHFGISAYVCINKYDLNPGITEEIEKYCGENSVGVIGKISFEPRIIRALQEFKTPIEAGLGKISDEIFMLWKNLAEKINNDEQTGGAG